MIFIHFLKALLLCKQCLCSHKGSKQLSGVAAGKLFLLVGGSSPQTPFRRISFCGCAPFRRFSIPPFGGDFLKTVRMVYQHDRKLVRRWKRHFFKIRQARRAAASVKRCSKGLGCFPTSKTCGFRHRREPQVLSVCIYKRPACPVVKACTVRQPSTKFFLKALTGASVCVTIVGN